MYHWPAVHFHNVTLKCGRRSLNISERSLNITESCTNDFLGCDFL